MELFDVYSLFDVVPVKASGCRIWDDKGSCYLDLYGGHAVISIGHSHPAYIEALTEQVNKIGFYSNSVVNPLQQELAGKLGDISGYGDYTLFLDNAKAGSLVKSTWGQGSANSPTYNIMCPTKDGKHCITGCVATAMGTIIHYWKYPVKGGTEGNYNAMTSWDGQTIRYKFRVDSNKFVYDSMPNKLSRTSVWEEKRAVGKLLFACGVTVGMKWGLDGSSASSNKVPEALWRYFGYSNKATYLKRDGVSDNEWNRLLHVEIEENGRPVYYRATSPRSTGTDANHAFVICGVSGSSLNRYWVNWGWNGSSNGFYTLTPMASIERSSSYTFTDGHAMIHHIYPNKEGIMENSEMHVAPAFPNPASGQITIPVDLTFNAILTVFAADGSVVHHTIVPTGTKVYTLNLQGFAAGTYFYRLNGVSYKFSVVK